MPKKTSILDPHAAEIKELLRQGKSFECIGNRFDVHYGTVRDWAKKHGLTRPPIRRNIPSVLDPHAAEIKKLFRQGKSFECIGSRFDVHYGTVRHWARKHGLTRPPIPRNRRSILDPHAAEIKKLLRQGKSYGFIGRRFDVGKETVRRWAKKHDVTR